MLRTIALYLAPALLIGAGWMRLEEGDRPGYVVVWMALLALAPALVRPRSARVLVAVFAVLLAVRAAFGVSPLDARPFDSDHDFFGPVLSGVRDGVLDFYEVGLPFNPQEQPLMHSVLLLAIFSFCLAVALGVAARRPLAAALALLVGAAWPATLVSGSGLFRGALILATVLTLLAWARPRPSRTVRPAALAGTALIAAALTASSSDAVAKGEFLNWKRWDPYDRPAQPVSVRYVWNANYGGISFPKKETTVLTVTGPRRSQYWRATTLDVFDGLRWLEELRLLGRSDEPVELPADPLLPAVARDRGRWLGAEVTIEALKDRRLPGPSVPVAYDPQRIGAIDYGAGGPALLVTDLEHGDRYTVWAYAPRPTAVQLARSGQASTLGDSPESAYLQLVPGATAPSFSASDRDAQLAELFAHDVFGPRLRPYRPLFAQAREVVGRPRNQYAAVVALEAWLRSEGGFRYDEQPPLLRGAPPLVSFVTDHKRGYCQHYAGAMALMLRYLGIPARVAAGFTSGDYESKRRRWRVSDHDAHAWVEVWFQGWGWLPFDPTPGRGQLSGTYTSASVAFNPRLAQQAAGGLGIAGASSVLGEFLRSRLQGTGKEPDVVGGLSGVGATVSERGASLVRLLALVAAALIALIALAKLTIRLVRHVTHDPRKVAAACRRELIDFLADQRLDVPAGATLGELANTVSVELGVDARPFAQATAAARFAPAAEASRAARQARRELRALRGSLRRSLGPARRARGFVSLRSLGFTS